MANRIEQQFGNYRLIRLLGQGGLASVYLSEHMYLKTQVAIKVLDSQLSSDDLEVFLAEARNTARLIHPHILRTLDFGIQQNSPFLVMDYIPGGTLRQHYPKGVQLPLGTVVSYVKQVTDALQYVHEKNIIHRDIKPENMLLGQNKNILLGDFGIAVLAQNLDTHSQSLQEIVGTLPYMAPEQIQGKPCLASDQYSLGVVVYEWLSGAQPFTGRNPQEIISMHLSVPPPSLHTKIPSLPLTAEQVIFKALSKKPEERYASVKEFALALEQASQPNQVLLKQDLQEDLFASPSPPAILGTIISSYSNHSDNVTAVAWSPDGKRIASASYDQTVQVRDVDTGIPITTYRGHLLGVYAVAWSPDGKRIASGSWDKTVQVWDVNTGGTILTYRGHSSWVRAVAWSSDGKLIASASYDQTVQVWNANNGRNNIIYCGHSDVVNTIAWSTDNSHIVSGSKDKTVHIWNVTTGKRILNYQGHTDEVNAVAWSPDGTYIVSAGDDKAVQISDATAGSHFNTYLGHTASVTALAWSPNGMRIASGSKDKTIKVWDVTTSNNVFTYRGHNAEVYSLAWSPDSTHIASGSWDDTVQIWTAVGHADKVDRWDQTVKGATFGELPFRAQESPTIQAPPPPSFNLQQSTNPVLSTETSYPPTVTNSQPSAPTNVGRVLSPLQRDSIDANEIRLSLFAIARASFEEEDKIIVGEAYSVQAGVSQSKPEDFKGEAFDLTVPSRTLPAYLAFDTLIHTSENIELTTEWHKTLIYDPRNPDPQLVEFAFQVVGPGHSSLIIDFYRKRRWLSTIRLEFEVIEPLQFTANSSEV